MELPFELEHRIFHLAGSLYPVCIPRLVLVAWRVKEWVEPLLYRTFALNADDEALPVLPKISPEILQRILSSKSPEFLRENVHNLFIRRCRDVDFISTLLCTFSNLRNLFFLTSEDMFPTGLDFSGQLQHLYSDFWELLSARGYAFGDVLFTSLTHLELFDGFPDPDQRSQTETDELVSGLASLPSLTHLSLDWTVADHIPTLQAFVAASLKNDRIRAVVLVRPQPSPRVAACVHDAGLDMDVRFVLVVCPDYTTDWQRGVLYGEDYWTRADELIARRRSGEVDRKVFIVKVEETSSGLD
ncbi:hypothetical protein MKEN_00318600 [Mycena kentingensis (nom. inval.)]|nr:hypothetical protein MKEN_00318600 [Mycena kentingensis (nom. inval.)]